MSQIENQNAAAKNRPRLSIKLLTLIPVCVLSFVCILSNIVAVHNIQSVNRTATTIADDYMTGIFNLSNSAGNPESLFHGSVPYHRNGSGYHGGTGGLHPHGGRAVR